MNLEKSVSQTDTTTPPDTDRTKNVRNRIINGIRNFFGLAPITSVEEKFLTEPTLGNEGKPDQSNFLLSELRELLYNERTQQNFDKICKTIDKFANLADVSVALEYASSHLASWPDHLRCFYEDLHVSRINEWNPPVSWPLVRDWMIKVPNNRMDPTTLGVNYLNAEDLADLNGETNLLKDINTLRVSAIISDTQQDASDVSKGLVQLAKKYPNLKIRVFLHVSDAANFLQFLNNLPAALPQLAEIKFSINGDYTQQICESLSLRTDLTTKITDLRIIGNAQAPVDQIAPLANAEYPRLRSIYLAKLQLTDQVLVNLISRLPNPTLENLELLALLGVSSQAVIDIVELPQVTNLQSLVLTGMGGAYRTSSSLESIANSNHLTNLKRLKFDSSIEDEVNNEALETLSKSTHLPALNELTLSGKFGDRGIIALAESKTITGLNFLSLTGGFSHESDIPDPEIMITGAGVSALVNSANAEQLRLLGLSCNGADGDGIARAIAQSSRLSKLEDLSLESCRITDSGFKTLGETANLPALLLFRWGNNPAFSKKTKQALRGSSFKNAYFYPALGEEAPPTLGENLVDGLHNAINRTLNLFRS